MVSITLGIGGSPCAFDVGRLHGPGNVADRAAARRCTAQLASTYKWQLALPRGLFPNAIESIHTGHWNHLSHVAINKNRCRRFRRVTATAGSGRLSRNSEEKTRHAY